MDNGSQDRLTLIRMPQGGYVVQDAFSPARDGYMTMQHYASTSIDDALKFMRDKIAPIVPTDVGQARDKS